MMIDSSILDKAEQSILSVRLSTDGIAYAVTTPLSTENLPEWKEWPVDSSVSPTANLKKIVAEQSWLTAPFQRVHVFTVGKRFILIPADLFNSEEADIYFYHNFPMQNNESILCNIFRQHRFAVVFGMDKSAYDFLRQQYPDACFYSHISPLIDYFSAKSQQGDINKLYVNLRREAMDVFAFKKDRLHAVNSFRYNNQADRLYYLLYFWKTLDFEQEQDELYVYGPTEDNRPFIAELRRFIRKIFTINDTLIELQAIPTCE